MASNTPNPPTPNGPKPITLHARQDVNVMVDPNARLCVIACAHPDGLLGAYQVVIPFHQLKRVVSAITMTEGKAELVELQKAAQRPRLVDH